LAYNTDERRQAIWRVDGMPPKRFERQNNKRISSQDRQRLTKGLVQ
jgi:hypothetical protein